MKWSWNCFKKNICGYFFMSVGLSPHALCAESLQTSLSHLQDFSKESSIHTLTHLHNPFAFKTPDVQTDLELYAIVNGKALIAGEWLHKNDLIQNYKVIDIQPQYIILGRGRTHFHLNIGDSIHKNHKNHKEVAK